MSHALDEHAGAIAPPPFPDAPAAPSRVVVLHWPRDAGVRAQLRLLRTPRLLLVEPGQSLPVSDEPLEDWMFVTGTQAEREARIAALDAAVEATTPGALPVIDEYDLLRHEGRWVALSATESPILRLLLERLGRCVPASELIDDPVAGAAALRSTIKRLRERIRPLGLEITTVRSRGFILGVGRPLTEPS